MTFSRLPFIYLTIITDAMMYSWENVLGILRPQTSRKIGGPQDPEMRSS